MEPQLVAWRNDANSFELPLNVQKGLLFVTGLRLCFALSDAERVENRRQARSLSRCFPDLNGNLGQNFDNLAVADLLVEFSQKAGVMPRVSQRRLPSGASIPSYSVPSVDRLPSFGPEDLTSPGKASRVGKALYERIGGEIQEELEGSFLAGCYFFTSHGQMDPQSTYQLVENARRPQPPHMQWMKTSLRFPPDQIAQGNVVQKVLSTLIAGHHKSLLGLFSLYSDQLHYTGPGVRRDDVWSADLETFVPLAVQEAEAFTRRGDLATDLKFAHDLMFRQGFELGRPQSPQERSAWVYTKLQDRWGYDLKNSSFYRGEDLDVRCCILVSSIENAIMSLERP